MKYGSICSGIEAASVAWHSLGWKCQFVSEIEPFPCSLLNHHYPTVPNYGDMTKHHEWPKHDLDVLVGGTPCQAFSVAGLRAGLADPRGNLTLTFLSIVEQYKPRWVVWENVPGVLSDKTGAFGAFLGGLGQLGYGFAYRVLDAQYFGLAQRRKRVFVVGHIGGQWQRAAAVLFERESLRGDSAPVREARKDFAGCAQDGIAECGNTISKCNAGGGAGKVDGCNYIPVGKTIGQQGGGRADGLGQRYLCSDVSTIDAKNNYDRGDNQHCERLIVENSFGTDLYNGAITGNIAATMGTAGSSAGQTGPTVAIRMRSGCEGGGKGALISNEQSLTLGTINDQTIIAK